MALAHHLYICRVISMNSSTRRLSPQTVHVLQTLAAQGDGWLYGLEIAAATGLKSGSLYPILIRLDERGLLEGRWTPSEKPGRPQRHAYRITGAGRTALREATAVTPALKPQGSPA
jgi:DNA-binding MarR family transcriptional regulator